ncbi:hypothetical protein WA026_001362, partial [Henosepilachna vigintioctopunctata]
SPFHRFLQFSNQGNLLLTKSVSTILKMGLSSGFLLLSIFLFQGKPWPASAQGYEDFSQLNPVISVQGGGSTRPTLQSSNNQVINLDFSQPGVNVVSQLQNALAPQLSGANIPSSQQRVVPFSLQITPPANSGQDYITLLQNAIKSVVRQFAPTAGSQMQFRFMKSSAGYITGIQVFLNVTIPPANQPLTPSNVPEIDLSISDDGLSQSLINIISSQLSQNGYVAGSNQVQNFNLAFSVLPPKGASKDYVKLYVLKPLQAALRQVAPGASISSVSVNTQQRGNEILRQIVNFSVKVNPSSQQNGNVINIPSIDFSQSLDLDQLRIILQNQIGRIASVNPSQQKNLAIPFRITNPQAANKEQIQNIYIKPIQNILSQINPNGGVTKVAAKTTPDGDLLINFDYTLLPNTSEEGENPVNNRDGEISITPSTESTISPKNENLIPKNAVIAPLVDLTKPTASLNDIQGSLDYVFSPKANPEPSKPKTIGIPVQIKAPIGASPDQIQNNVVKPIEGLLTKLEPTGDVITSTTNTLPNGDLGTVVYFGVPSVENTNTYKNLEKKTPEVSTHDINLDQPGSSVSGEVSKALVSSLVINPKKKDKSALIDLNVYTPPNSSPSKIQNVVDDITADLKRQEPTGEVVSTKVNPNPSQTEPDAKVQYFVPSIKNSKTAQNANNAISIPTIDINTPGIDLVSDIQNGLKNNADKIKPNEPQFFDLSFKMNPFNEKGSIDQILKALKSADPDGQVASYKIKTGDDGLEYLDVVYVLTKKRKPIEVSVVDIDARKPMNNLLNKVISNVNAAVTSLKGVVPKGQIVDIPLNFRLTNTEGLSNSQISQIIDQFYPSLKNYIGQALPDGKILSSNTFCPEDSDDVILETTVRTPYDPDDVIVIEEVHRKRPTTTTEKTGIFGFKIFA